MRFGPQASRRWNPPARQDALNTPTMDLKVSSPQYFEWSRRLQHLPDQNFPQLSPMRNRLSQVKAIFCSPQSNTNLSRYRLTAYFHSRFAIKLHLLSNLGSITASFQSCSRLPLGKVRLTMLQNGFRPLLIVHRRHRSMVAEWPCPKSIFQRNRTFLRQGC